MTQESSFPATLKPVKEARGLSEKEHSETPASDERLGPIIHQCTRADLLTFGDLMDVTLPAFCIGFKLPVAVSRAVWIECVAPYEDCIEQPGEQAAAIRLSTLLFAAVDAARKNPAKAELLFSFALKRAGKAPKRKKLQLICSAGDDGEPVLTVLERYEDSQGTQPCR